MKIIYLECNMGASGDMIIGALAQLFDDIGSLENELNSLGLANVKYCLENAETCGISGIKARVIISGEEEKDGCADFHCRHSHMSLDEIYNIIESANAPNKVKADAKEVYCLIAQAESKVHNKNVTEIHFHELGMLDAVADVLACSYLFNKLDADKICVSPINAGNGTVRCAHGILPVPAPATADLLRGVPFYFGDINSELCTPTGAALIKYFATDFSVNPVMTVNRIGYGIGSKRFETANCLRAFYGEAENNRKIIELSCNIDDMTGEEIAYACEVFIKEGALDVYTALIGMKKMRNAVKITVQCNENERDKFLHLIFKHTSTIGIRQCEFQRFELDKKIETMNTPLGEVKIKKSRGYSLEKSKPEFEDLKKIADDNNISIKQVRQIIDEK